MGARNRLGIGLSYTARQATQPGGIGFLESIIWLLKSLKIRAQATKTSGIDSLESIHELLKSLKIPSLIKHVHGNGGTGEREII
jgi:hypothetical protein